MRTILILPLLILVAALPALADEPHATPGTAAPGDEAAMAAPAQDEAKPGAAVAEAQKVLVGYLDLVKKKRWPQAKKLVHPKTLEVIAGMKKRMGKEEHPLAPAYWAKGDFWLKEYKIVGAAPHALGTVSFDVHEDNYRVQEKGISEGDQASYLVGKLHGKWLVVDKKNNGSFADDSIKIDYKGYFDAAPEPGPEKSDEGE